MKEIANLSLPTIGLPAANSFASSAQNFIICNERGVIDSTSLEIRAATSKQRLVAELVKPNSCP